MPMLQPVEHDPFAPVTVPVDHDPFADEQLAASMTHWPERPNPAAPAVEFGKRIVEHFRDKAVSALTAPRDALYGNMLVTDPETGMPTREAMERGQGVAGMAMTGGVPFAQRGAAGMAGGKLGVPGDRISFESTGARRGEGSPTPSSEPVKRTIGDLTPEEKAAWKKAADAEMEAHIAKVEARKAARKAGRPSQQEAEPVVPLGPEDRIGFESTGARRGTQMSVGPPKTFYEISREYPSRSNNAFHQGADAYARATGTEYTVPPAHLTQEELRAWDDGVRARMRFEAQPVRTEPVDHDPFAQ